MNETMDNAYGALVEAEDDARWAFGTGFHDPLAGLDLRVPDGVDGAALAAYCLGLADDALVLAQRLTQWCTRAPELEEEVALANIALDLLGQARLLYNRAAAADPACVPALSASSPVPAEDRLAYFRDADAFRSVALVEHPDTDFATAMVRLAAFAGWRLALLEELSRSVDPVLAAVGEKGAKEVRYHRDHAARWVVVLAGGTEESRARTQAALEEIWPLLAELALDDPATAALAAAGVVPPAERPARTASEFLGQLLARAGLAASRQEGTAPDHGRMGGHGPWREPLLAELQGLARAHPEARW